MEWITKELEQRFEEIGSQADTADPIVIAKFVDPLGTWAWYAVGYIPESETFYGYIQGTHFNEWEYFSIQDLEEYQLPYFGYGIGREEDYKEKRISELCPELKPEIEQYKSLLKLRKNIEQEKGNALER